MTDALSFTGGVLKNVIDTKAEAKLQLQINIIKILPIVLLTAGIYIFIGIYKKNLTNIIDNKYLYFILSNLPYLFIASYLAYIWIRFFMSEEEQKKYDKYKSLLEYSILISLFAIAGLYLYSGYKVKI